MLTRHSRWWSPALPLALALTALTACANPAPTPSSSTPQAAVFETEEEALAALTQATTTYLDVTAAVLADPAADVASLDAVAETGIVTVERETISEFRAKGWRAVGAPVLRAAVVRQWFRHSDSAGVAVTGRTCVDYSTTDVLDANGDSVVQATREVLQAFDVSVGSGDHDADTLVIVEKTSSSDREVCS